MSDLADISKVVSNMQRDLQRLGECRKMLASPGLIEAMLNLHREQAAKLGMPDPTLEGAELCFKGSPVIECEHLEDLEYAFVR